KRLAVFKIRLRLERLRRRIRSFPFLSPPVGGSLHSQRSLRAPRGSTFSKLNDYILPSKIAPEDFKYDFEVEMELPLDFLRAGNDDNSMAYGETVIFSQP
ncbi:MAG: hypothetical protein LBQ86_02435, partial [Holophagales bacterium]|nr:hypothetical protein [Holophagales bacterium]